MKTKFFVIVLAMALIFGFSNVSYSQVIAVDTIATDYGIGWASDFDGFQGTLDDSASHYFGFTIPATVDSIDTIYIMFPFGTRVANPETLSNFKRPTADSLVVIASDDSTIAISTQVYGSVGGARDSLWGSVNMRIAVSGVRTDSVPEPGGQVSDRFYLDTILVVFDTTFGDGSGENAEKAIRKVPMYLQSANPDSFYFSAVTFTGTPADTVGLDIGNFTIKLKDRYDNIVRDTVAQVAFTIVEANPPYKGMPDLLPPWDGKVYDIGATAERDTIKKPVLGVTGAILNSYGFTKARSIRAKGYYAESYGFKGTTADRSASSASPVISMDQHTVTLNAAAPLYLDVSPTHVSDLEVVTSQQFEVWVTDQWDNPCDADSIYFIRDFQEGSYLASDGTTLITTARDTTRGLDAAGYAKFYYKAGPDIGIDTLRFTVRNTEDGNSYPTDVTKKVDIAIVAGAVNKIRITPTSVTLVASPNNERYANNTYGSEGAVVAGDTVVFYAKIQDTFGNQKNVDATELDKIYFYASSEVKGVKTTYRSIDGSSRWLGGGSIVSSGGYNVAKFKFYTPTTISRDSIIAYYLKTAIDSINSGIDNTIAPAGKVGTRFTTVGGKPAEVAAWYLPNALETDTVEVTGGALTSPTVQIQAILLDKNGNWADTLQTDLVRFAVKSHSPDSRGTAGFVYLVRTATDDTSAHKNKDRIDLSTDLVDTTSVITKFIADSAKGTATISLSFGSTELSTIDIFKQPDRDIAELVATISNVNPPETDVTNTASELLSGFYAGATREVFAQFKDEYENFIEPDTIPGDNVPKYSTGVLGIDELEFTTMREINLDADSLGAYLMEDTTFGGIDDEPDLMNNVGYAKVAYKALGGADGEDTLIVRFLATPTINDSIKIVISLPLELHHFVYTVLTKVAPSDTADMTDVPQAAGAYHKIVIRPNDEVGNPIFGQAYRYMKLELLPAAGEVLGVDTNKAAPSVTDKLPVIHWDVPASAALGKHMTLVDSVGGTAWSSVIHAGEDTTIEGDSTAVMVTSTKTLNNAKIAVTVEDTAGNVVYDTLGREWAGAVTPKLLKWIPTSTDTLEISTVGELAEQTQFKLKIEPKDIFKNLISDTTYVVNISASDAGVSGIENPIMVTGSKEITISVDHPTDVSFLATSSQTKKGKTIDVRGFTDDLTVGAATISPPAALNATDFPGDAGGNVLLKFPASANHPGMDGDTDDNLAIDYYQVYRNSTSSLESSIYWAFIPATPILASKDDTIRAVVSTNGAVGTAYYWVAAVKGDLIPPVSPMGKVAADLGENVVAALNVEASACEAKEDLAVLTKDGLLISAASPANKARPINNTVSMAADLDGSYEIDILDIAIITEIYDYPSEYDPVIDLNNDGTIDILDIAVITEVYGQVALPKGAPVKIANDGVNISSSIKLASSMSDFGDYFTMSVSAEQVKELAGYQFAVSYNPDDYELASINEGDFLSSNDGTSLFIYNDKTEGKVIVAGILFDISDEIAVDGSGIFATLVFNWIGDEVSELTVDNIKLMDTNQRLNTLEQLVLEKPIAMPTEFNLAQNYPNPFNPETTIKYSLPKSVNVEITIYNILGQKVKTLLNEPQKAGFKKAKWDGTNDYGLKVGSGVYIYRLKAGEFVDQMKMVFLK